MRNQLQTYFLPDDESALSHGLRSLSPSIFFIDHDEARKEKVKVHKDLNACTSGYAYIWDAETDDDTDALAKWNEIVRLKRGGGVMMQFLRSRIKTEELVTGDKVSLLLSGSVAMMGIGTEKQKDLKVCVYLIVSRIATAELYPVSPTTREPLGPKQLGSRVGFHAVEWCNDSTHLLRDTGNKLLYGLPNTRNAK
jgi:hypothetical protein